MKRLLRMVLKIPATAIVIPLWSYLLLTGYAVQLIEWVYEANEADRSITASINQDYKNLIKRWFTTI